MHYFKIILLMIFLTSCGKSPLLNKAQKTLAGVTGTTEVYSNNNESTKDKLSFALTWIVAPTLDDLSSFELTLEKPLKENQRIESYLWMPEMGHGSSPIEIKIVSPKKLIFSELAFIMPGLWTLHINLLEDDKVIDQWQKDITL